MSHDAAEATAAGPPGAPPARVTLRPIRGGDLQVLRAAAKKCDIWSSLQDTESEVLHVALDFEPALLRCAAKHIDELYLASSRPPLAGDAPPSYGASDHAIVRSSWAEGVRPRGAAVALKRSNNPHYCSYMSSEQRQTTEVCGDATARAIRRNSARNPRAQ